MNKKEEYLKFYIDSNANIDSINKFIKKENISLNEYNDIVTTYLKELEDNKKINKLYIEYNLKFKRRDNNNKISKRKETETIINIINNYIKENKHNIKDYVNNTNLSYKEFKRFINNYKRYIKKFLKKRK